MVAAIRPDSWNFALFLHVLGAMVLVGGMTSVSALAWAGWGGSGRPLVARAAFRTLLVLVLPAWILMRLGAAWIESKEDIQGDPTWLGIGFAVAEPGLLLVLVTTGFAFWWSRRAGAGWHGRVVAVLGTIYVVALAVAWWVMSTKPG
jgi:hypothetical protein